MPNSLVLSCLNRLTDDSLCVRDCSPPIPGARGIGYSNACGPKFFDKLVTEMSHNVNSIDSASAQRLSNALAIGFKNICDLHHKPDVLLSSKEMNPRGIVPILSHPAEQSELVICRVLLDTNTGVCPVTKTRQHLSPLNQDQRLQVHDALLKLEVEKHAILPDGKRKDSADRAPMELRKFSEWLK